MAEDNEQSGEKEFEATEQRLRQARQEGDVPQSKEANTFALVGGMILAAFAFSSALAVPFYNQLSGMFYHADSYANDIFAGSAKQTTNTMFNLVITVAPVFLLVVTVVLLALIIQRAIAFSAKKIKPDMKKLNPAENLKKKYGPKGLLDFLKDTAKMLFAGVIASVFLYSFAQNYYASSAVHEGQFFQFTFSQVMMLFTVFGIFYFVLAAIDLPIQKQLHANKLRMTREDMKKEQKQSEGDPQFKQTRRQKAQKITRNEMLGNVKSSTVVMVNPEHYAVALKWDPNDSKAPVCVAKGVDHLAAKIREVALANDVPIHRDPPATRSIYRLVEIDEEIHAEHFAAVAAAISFAERLGEHM
ncbi:EscU/YscU/HrcU family type III secretion system export apparatus switch protein [Henriciella sp.]|uniref:EscU/YscU/HrcU family type III secretion system export apparatus switch protein n=1 Tax=Henriciella sp. TaxID=1968823 RepID=UPI0026191536|nr:EscU/YscU/HrcU family type III secretion system export apparatus switch protein [Henriciella sp.]